MLHNSGNSIPLKNPCLLDSRRGLADFIFSTVLVFSSFLRSEPAAELN